MWRFRAMGTDVCVAAPGLADDDEHRLAAQVASLFGETERRFSRFQDTSELAALNRATAAVEVSGELIELLEAAGDHVAATAGLFDPTIGGALCAAGYDRSFSPGALDRERPGAPVPRARFCDIAIDRRARIVRRPPHVQIDLGGFLKGRTVDRAAALVRSTSLAATPAASTASAASAERAVPAVIDAGGDAALLGAGPDGAGWLVDVEDPADARGVLVTLRLADRAVATSAANRRRWRIGDGAAHHLIDPRSGEPSDSDLLQVTAVAATAERADVIAKVAFLLGARDGARWLAGQADVAGVLVGRDGALRLVGELELADA